MILGLGILLFFGYQWILVEAVGFLNFIGASVLSLMMFFQGREYVRKFKVHPEISKFKQQKTVRKAIKPAYNQEKRIALIQKLRSMPELVIPVQEFMSGNYADNGAIGCNIYPDHPGIDAFIKVFETLLKRDDVDSIYAHVSEIEPDPGCWPYSDRVYVFGTISIHELEEITQLIQPTEIGDRKDIFSPITKDIRALSSKPLNCLWWD